MLDGWLDGSSLGSLNGVSLGLLDGSLDGSSLGSFDGVSLGLLDGLLDRSSLGLLDGVSLGLLNGSLDGSSLGLLDRDEGGGSGNYDKIAMTRRISIYMASTLEIPFFGLQIFGCVGKFSGGQKLKAAKN